MLARASRTAVSAAVFSATTSTRRPSPTVWATVAATNLAASTPEFEDFNRILLVVHGLETEITVTLPEHEGVEAYTLLWDSSLDDITGVEPEYPAGTVVHEDLAAFVKHLLAREARESLKISV